MSGRFGNRSGFALILTLVVTALMVAVAVEMIHQVYVDTSLSRGFRDGQQASILAESGAAGGAQLLQVGLSGRSYTSLTDQWATPLKLEDSAGSVEVTVSEESGKINVNALVQGNGEYEPFTRSMLMHLSTNLELPDIWGALADWLDKDDLPRSGGVETPYYRSQKPPYSARNGRLMTLTELSLVKDGTAEMAARLRPYLTVFSDQAAAPLPTLNINTAPREVLAVLDESIDTRTVERIMEERRVRPFTSTGEFSRIPELQALAMGAGKGILAVKGNLFRITAVARVKDSVRTVEAVVRLSGGSREFLSWQEY